MTTTRNVSVAALAVVAAGAALALLGGFGRSTAPQQLPGTVTVHAPAAYDVSAPLSELARTASQPLVDAPGCAAQPGGCGTSPLGRRYRSDLPVPVASLGEDVEQRVQGERSAAVLLDSFDGHGYGLVGPHGVGRGGNPSDNSLAVGPNHIVETVKAVGLYHTKQGELFDRPASAVGPIGVNVLFAGFGGSASARPTESRGQHDQLADRWLHDAAVPTRGEHPPGDTIAPYGMCYAISVGPIPLGQYYRYYFERELFPDYPRPAIWPDGYYVPRVPDNRLPDGTAAQARLRAGAR
jgi:hypothetical protein